MPLNNILIKAFVLFLLTVNLAHAGNIVDDTLQAVKLDDAAGVMEGLQRGMEVNFVDDEGNSLLMIAAREGSTQVSAILLNYGAKTFLNNAYGDNALLLATFAGHEAIVDMLLAKHASLGANPHGWTPLHYAAYAGHSHLIAKFVAFGANINSATDNGLTALMLASMNGHIEVVHTLLLNKADIELRDANNRTAADHAFAGSNTIIAHLLQAVAVNK